MDDQVPIPRPKRRWLWFAGLIAFAAFFAACLWGRNQLELANERREFLSAFDHGESQDLVIALSKHRLPPHQGVATAPWPISALGEEGVSLIWIDGRASADAKSAEIARLKGLFPEAEVAEAPQPVLKKYVAGNARLKRLKDTASPPQPTAGPAGK